MAALMLFWILVITKFVTYADEKGSGDVGLSVQSFTEMNDALAPQLIEHKLVSNELHDFQQRSYWLHLTSRKTVLLEAAGRSLGDLRLWRDGNWLLDLQSESEIIEPEAGKPLVVHRYVANLNPRSLFINGIWWRVATLGRNLRCSTFSFTHGYSDYRREWC